MKLLSKCLVSQEETKSDDKVWEWEHLFTEIASELQAEWDAHETPDQASNSSEVIAV